MTRKHDLTQTEIDQLRSLLDWWNKHQAMTYDKLKFDHSSSRICSVRLGKKLYEKADLFARSRPEYRSFSRMVEMLIWERLGQDPEFLRQSTDQGTQESD